MIKAIGWDGKLVLVGLSRANTEKLREGKPILLAPETLPGLRQFVLVVGGETEESLTKDLASLLPPGAVQHAAPAPGEEVRITADGAARRPAPNQDEVAARAAARAGGFDLNRFQQLARDIGDRIGTAVALGGGAGKVGFGLFLFSFGEGGWMTWLSNASRESMLPALKEWIQNNEAPPPAARG